MGAGLKGAGSVVGAVGNSFRGQAVLPAPSNISLKRSFASISVKKDDYNPLIVLAFWRVKNKYSDVGPENLT